MKRLVHAAAAVAVSAALMATTLGCQQKTPTAQASQPGRAPTWGQGFGTQAPNAQEIGTAVPAPAVAPAPEGQLAAVGGDLAAKGMPMPQAPKDPVHGGGGGNITQGSVGPTGMDWSGGDAAVGAREFTNLCARCHGPSGKGGMAKDVVGKVADLTSPEFHARNTDGAIASIIAHGRKEMPSFAGKLDGNKLRAIVAHIRSLKR